jgi:hypothetical protein
VSVVEDFEGIAVEDPDDEAMILSDSGGWRGCQDSEEHTEGPNREATVGTQHEGHREPRREAYSRRVRTRAQEASARIGDTREQIVGW